MNYLSLFSGGGLADEGAIAAGFSQTWGCEIDDKIASVARMNGHNIETVDVLKVNPNNMDKPDLFHASPVCTNASIANANGEESKLDIACGKKTAEFIRILKPKCVTIENVSGYRKFQSFREITNALDDCGYFYDVSILNSADFGVPQTRRRLIVRAVLGGFVPALPQPVKWNGWYQAIEDLIPGLEETHFANWQMARLPEEIKSFILNNNRNSMKWIQDSDVIDIDKPYATVVSNKHLPKMFIVGQQKFNDKLQIQAGDCPDGTITAQHNQASIKAFIVNGGSSDIPRRAVVNGTPNDYGKSVTIRGDNDPMYTLTASEIRRPARAYLESGRVIKLSPRCLARFQTLRDSYILPDNKGLAVKIIGNGVPCLMYQRIAESMATVL